MLKKLKIFIKKEWQNIIAGISLIAMIFVLFFIISSAAQQKYNEYIEEYNASPEIVTLDIQEFTLLQSGRIKVTCTTGDVYYTDTITFSEDAEQMKLVFMKKEQVDVGYFAFPMFMNSSNSIYTIYEIIVVVESPL